MPNSAARDDSFSGNSYFPLVPTPISHDAGDSSSSSIGSPDSLFEHVHTNTDRTSSADPTSIDEPSSSLFANDERPVLGSEAGAAWAWFFYGPSGRPARPARANPSTMRPPPRAPTVSDGVFGASVSKPVQARPKRVRRAKYGGFALREDEVVYAPASERIYQQKSSSGLGTSQKSQPKPGDDMTKPVPVEVSAGTSTSTTQGDETPFWDHLAQVGDSPLFLTPDLLSRVRTPNAARQYSIDSTPVSLARAWASLDKRRESERFGSETPSHPRNKESTLLTPSCYMRVHANMPFYIDDSSSCETTPRTSLSVGMPGSVYATPTKMNHNFSELPVASLPGTPGTSQAASSAPLTDLEAAEILLLLSRQPGHLHQ